MAKIIKSGPARKNTYFTKEGLDATKTELEFLKKTKRVEVADRIQRARDLGDLAENAEYEAALDEQALVEKKIDDIEIVLRSAKVIANSETGSEIVVIGSTVRVEMDGEIDEFTIVGKVEANPSKKKISNESPVGSALLGARKGEEVEVATPIVRYKAKVLDIK